jgi:pilus assembly protein TadC
VTTAVAPAIASALLAGAAAALVVGPGPVGSPPRTRASGRSGRTGTRAPEGADLLGRHPAAVSLLAALAPVLLVGGWVGLLGGLVTAVVVHRGLGRREPPAARKRRERVGRDLPQVVDLLGVALAAGAAPSTALAAVAAAVEGPVAQVLATIWHSLVLGRDPVRVWQEVAQRPGLAALGRAMARAVESGASVGDALHRLAEDLRSVSRAEAEGRARAVGVRAAVPLGVCLLPAFILLGIVPLVVGTVGSLLDR